MIKRAGNARLLVKHDFDGRPTITVINDNSRCTWRSRRRVPREGVDIPRFFFFVRDAVGRVARENGYDPERELKYREVGLPTSAKLGVGELKRFRFQRTKLGTDFFFSESTITTNGNAFHVLRKTYDNARSL